MKRMVHDGTRCSYKDAFSLCVREYPAVRVGWPQGVELKAMTGSVHLPEHPGVQPGSTCTRAGLCTGAQWEAVGLAGYRGKEEPGPGSVSGEPGPHSLPPALKKLQN